VSSRRLLEDVNCPYVFRRYRYTTLGTETTSPGEVQRARTIRTEFPGNLPRRPTGEPHAGTVEDDRPPVERHVLAVVRRTAAGRERSAAGVLRDAVRVAGKVREMPGHLSGHVGMDQGARTCLTIIVVRLEHRVSRHGDRKL